MFRFGRATDDPKGSRPRPPPATKRMPRLKVSIGPHRSQVEVAFVNDSSKPFEIDTELFVGRVLVRVKNFHGITPDGSPPAAASEYFAMRSRAFSIYIEGRFKARPGHAPYHGDEILFGSDFDHMVDFPKTIFNAGMRIAQFIDSCVFYEEKAKRPYIMSPYCACMNSVAAWAAPSRMSDAVVCRRAMDYAGHSSDSDSELDVVPEEELVHDIKKDSRHEVPHWRFVGLRSDARVAKWLDQHAPELLEAHQVHENPAQRVHEAIGVPSKQASANSTSSAASVSAQPLIAPVKQGSADSGKGHFHFGHFKKALEEAHDTPPKSSRHDHVTTADHLSGYATPTRTGSRVDSQLGRWRFTNPAVDILEDNTFVFLDKSVPVAKRRKYFQHKQNRLDFIYDPDIVYGAAFFSPLGDLNSFDVNMSKFVHINVKRFLGEMPIRYTLRSTRLHEAPNGEMEEEVFATICFELVDD